MPTVGRVLGAERVRQGLDLDRVAAITKITPRALRAIEADDFEQLPGLMFARNFVGQYARALNLDPAAAVAQFNREQSMAAPETAAPESQARLRVPKMPGPVFGGLFEGNTISAFFTLIITLAVCAGMFYAFEYLRARKVAPAVVVAPAPKPTPKKSVTAAPVQAPAPAVSAPLPAPLPAPSPAPLDALDSPQVALGGSNVHVAVVARAACWAKVTADGKVLFAGMLAPGDARSFNAAVSVSIRAGNAAALAIKLNGNDVPPIGPEGQIRTVNLTTAGAQVRTPTPEPVLDF